MTKRGMATSPNLIIQFENHVIVITHAWDSKLVYFQYIDCVCVCVCV